MAIAWDRQVALRSPASVLRPEQVQPEAERRRAGCLSSAWEVIRHAASLGARPRLICFYSSERSHLSVVTTSRTSYEGAWPWRSPVRDASMTVEQGRGQAVCWCVGRYRFPAPAAPPSIDGSQSQSSDKTQIVYIVLLHRNNT